MNMLPSKRKSPQVSESRASLAGLIENTSATLNAVSARLKDGVASAEELIKCSKLAAALSGAIKLYAEKMADTNPSSTR